MPSLSVLEKFAQRLGVPMSSLLGEEEAMTPPEWVVEELEKIVSHELDMQCLPCRQIAGRIFHLLAKIHDQRGASDLALEAYRKASHLLITE